MQKLFLLGMLLLLTSCMSVYEQKVGKYHLTYSQRCSLPLPETADETAGEKILYSIEPWSSARLKDPCNFAILDDVRGPTFVEHAQEGTSRHLEHERRYIEHLSKMKVVLIVALPQERKYVIRYYLTAEKNVR
jgi:hypothetical protein